MKKLAPLFLMALVLGTPAFAAESEPDKAKPATNLEEQLNALGTPGNSAPAGLTSENLYSVQTRYFPLKNRFELAFGGASNFSSDSYLSQRTLELSARFYLNNRWYLGGSASSVFNQYTDGGNRLVEENKLIPDVAVTLNRADLLVGFNLFYGKLRFTMNSVMYFDSYVALGGGRVWMNTGQTWAAVADAGLAFWMGKHFTLRAGFKDYFHKERRLLDESNEHNILGYLQAGFVFGG